MTGKFVVVDLTSFDAIGPFESREQAAEYFREPGSTGDPFYGHGIVCVELMTPHGKSAYDDQEEATNE